MKKYFHIKDKFILLLNIFVSVNLSKQSKCSLYIPYQQQYFYFDLLCTLLPLSILALQSTINSGIFVPTHTCYILCYQLRHPRPYIHLLDTPLSTQASLLLLCPRLSQNPFLLFWRKSQSYRIAKDTYNGNEPFEIR